MSDKRHAEEHDFIEITRKCGYIEAGEVLNVSKVSANGGVIVEEGFLIPPTSYRVMGLVEVSDYLGVPAR